MGNYPYVAIVRGVSYSRAIRKTLGALSIVGLLAGFAIAGMSPQAPEQVNSSPSRPPRLARIVSANGGAFGGPPPTKTSSVCSITDCRLKLLIGVSK